MKLRAIIAALAFMLTPSLSWAFGPEILLTAMQEPLATSWNTYSFETDYDGWTTGGFSREATSAYDGSWALTATSPGQVTMKDHNCGRGYIYFWYRTTAGGSTMRIDDAVAFTMPNTSGAWEEASIYVTRGTHNIKFRCENYNTAIDYILLPIPM